MTDYFSEKFMDGIIRVAKRIDAENEAEFKKLEEQLKTAQTQYGQVVKQNKDLQAERNYYKNSLRSILDYCTEFQDKLGQPDMLCIEIKNRIYEALK